MVHSFSLLPSLLLIADQTPSQLVHIFLVDQQKKNKTGYTDLTSFLKVHVQKSYQNLNLNPQYKNSLELQVLVYPNLFCDSASADVVVETVAVSKGPVPCSLWS